MKQEAVGVGSTALLETEMLWRKKREETLIEWAIRTGQNKKIAALYNPAPRQGQAPRGTPPDINYRLHYIWPTAERHLGLTNPHPQQIAPLPGRGGVEYEEADRPWEPAKMPEKPDIDDDHEAWDAWGTGQ